MGSASTSTSADTWVWDRGDYSATASDLHRLSEEAVRRAGPISGQAVLDLGTGTGNAALLAAATGATVTGVDLAVGLLDQARGRARDAGLTIDFVHGDLHALPFPDASFDVALSVSAAVLVPEPRRTAAEIVRVLRPGGRAVVVGWFDDSILGRMMAQFPVVTPEMLAADPGWYAPDRVERLFADLPATVTTTQVPFAFSGADTDALVERMTSRHPVMVAARAEHDDTTWDALVGELRATFEQHVEQVDGGVALSTPSLVVELTRDA
jgi:SAM-dependent methyltransferase